MKILLDTHTALWMVNEHEKLSSLAKSMILNDEHELFISVASLWEMAIKVSLGKLTDLDGGIVTFLSKIDSMPIEILPISTEQIRIVETLMFIHRDPFDRMLIATAMANDMTILTADSDIRKYKVTCVW
jgi:PIN domain nuclease of toxin-antitoxin system